MLQLSADARQERKGREEGLAKVSADIFIFDVKPKRVLKKMTKVATDCPEEKGERVGAGQSAISLSGGRGVSKMAKKASDTR